LSQGSKTAAAGAKVTGGLGWILGLNLIGLGPVRELCELCDARIRPPVPVTWPEALLPVSDSSQASQVSQQATAARCWNSILSAGLHSPTNEAEIPHWREY